jgi:SAM-dependent methyltransferase
LFQPYADDLADRLSNLTAGRLLETAAGTGIVTETLARRLPSSVLIVATDLNQPMIDHPKSKPGVERVRFQQADALELPFPDNGFDVLVCQFGVMFFPDRQQGFREARRVLKPGGRLLFNVWDRIDKPPVDTPWWPDCSGAIRRILPGSWSVRQAAITIQISFARTFARLASRIVASTRSYELAMRPAHGTSPWVCAKARLCVRRSRGSTRPDWTLQPMPWPYGGGTLRRGRVRDSITGVGCGNNPVIQPCLNGTKCQDFNH